MFGEELWILIPKSLGNSWKTWCAWWMSVILALTNLQRWARFNMILLLHWPFGCHSELFPRCMCLLDRESLGIGKTSSPQFRASTCWDDLVIKARDSERKPLQSYRDGQTRVTIHGSLAEVLFQKWGLIQKIVCVMHVCGPRMYG